MHRPVFAGCFGDCEPTEFYTKQLGFKLEMHPAPPFAEISPGDMQIYLTQPGGMGGGSHMPSGEQQAPRLESYPSDG